MKSYNYTDIMAMEKRFRTTFINSISGFKSLNLVGTVNQEGQTNLAVFNSIFHVGAHPPLLGMIFRPDEAERHTLENIISTQQYTLNHVHPGIVKKAHQTSARYPKQISEFETTGLSAYFTSAMIAPYVKESKVKIGLHLKEKIAVNANKTTIIIGEINEIIIDENAIIEDGYVDLEKLETCTVAGLDAYFTTNKIARLSYAKTDKNLSEIG